MNKKVMVVAAHPDDEVLGCGGTIIKHVDSGDEVTVVFLTNGESSREGITELEVQRRKNNSVKALKILGIKNSVYLDFPDNELDLISNLEVTKKIERCIIKFEPEIVYTHHYNDLNIDHEHCYRAVLTACRPLHGNNVKRILTFKVLSATGWLGRQELEFKPNVYISTEESQERKVAALNCYLDEMREYPHARSIQNILMNDKVNGSFVNRVSAECFMLIRENI